MGIELLYAIGGAVLVWVLQKKPTPPANPSQPTLPGLPVPKTGNPLIDLILQRILDRIQGEAVQMADHAAARVLPPAEQAVPPSPPVNTNVRM